MANKRCKDCGQPMLRKGQERKDPGDYRHASGCPAEEPRMAEIPHVLVDSEAW